MENSVKNKSELLEQLKINREEETDIKGISAPSVISLIILTAILSISGTYWFISPEVNTENSDLGETNTAESLSIEPSTTSLQPVTSDTTPRSESILNASGYITARRMATVSAEIMGLITAVNVEEGMQVGEGQILAQLDDTLAKVGLDLAIAQIASLKARKESAQSSLAEAERQFKRAMENQFSSDADKTGAKTNLETSKATLASAIADIEVAQLEVNRQQERLADHTIRAPFAGVVTVKNAQPGEIVAPSSAGGGFTRTGICTIVDMDSLEIEVDVNESFIGRVFAGQKVEANLDAYPDWKIPASVIAIIPTADRARATVRVRIKLELKDERILPDMGVKVAFLKS